RYILYSGSSFCTTDYTHGSYGVKKLTRLIRGRACLTISGGGAGSSDEAGCGLAGGALERLRQLGHALPLDARKRRRDRQGGTRVTEGVAHGHSHCSDVRLALAEVHGESEIADTGELGLEGGPGPEGAWRPALQPRRRVQLAKPIQGKLCEQCLPAGNGVGG